MYKLFYKLYKFLLLDVQNYGMTMSQSNHQFVESAQNYPQFRCTRSEMSRFLLPKYNVGVAELQTAKNLPFLLNPPRIYLFMKNNTYLFYYLVPSTWCTISYYEYDKKVGENFQVPSTSSEVFIDGGFNSSCVNRFCLGATTNLDRTDECDNCRLFFI